MAANNLQPTLESEARLLLLIEAFSRRNRVLEGRTKLAKLDFLVRYPEYFTRALAIRRPGIAIEIETPQLPDVETRMVRYRYGPWDPAYFALLGRLMGKGLIKPAPFNRGIGYRVTDLGRSIASTIGQEPAWRETQQRIELLRKHFNLAGGTLKKFIYDNFPEVTQATWGQPL